ncbi:MAG: MBL fold metallo-hydrolase [Rhodothermales bacterium]
MKHARANPGPRRVKRRKWPRVVGAILGLLILGTGIIMIDSWSALGTRPEGARLERLQRSPQFAGGRFANRLPPQEPEMWPVLKRWLFEDNPLREPSEPVPVVRRVAQDFTSASAEPRITWFGHSSLLVEMDGQRILIDPMWGDYASPGRLFGVKRFFAPPIPLDDLPPIDAVILSHDHYDHLDEPTIKALRERVPLFAVPLGLGAHLEYWGVPPERIVELDWWERVTVGGVELVCTPARHFSGRMVIDRDATLWAGWALLGQTRRVFFSGDSGLFPGFAEIGARLGPFDVTMMESGAYNADWPDVHMGPEQAVEAHRMVRGRLMLPIHWGTFNLAFHGWTEPVERLLVAAERAGVQVAIPRPGESILPASPPAVERWWPSQPWQTAEEAPVVSTGLVPVVAE